MSTTPEPRFLDALPEGFLAPEQTPVIFHLMGPHKLLVVNHPEGESVPHRARRFMTEPPPKPVSRCFPR
jgi:hypothetical protein